MSDLYRKRVLGAKIETTPGTAISLSGSDAAMNVFNLVANPTAASEQRMGQGAFGQLASVVGLQTGQFTFMTELYGSSGAAPSWLQTLFAGCGVSYSAGVFSPKSEMPGSNVKTLTLGAYTNGVYKQIAGAMIRPRCQQWQNRSRQLQSVLGLRESQTSHSTLGMSSSLVPESTPMAGFIPIW